MTTAHRRNSNATYPNSHVRTNCGIHTRSTGSRTTSVPFVKDAIPRAGFEVDDGGLGVAIANLRLSPVPNHPRTTNSGSGTGSMALASSSRFERTNNVPPRHRSGEKEYTQLGLQSPREKHWDRYFEQQQPPRRQHQQHATGYYNSSKYQLQMSNAPRSNAPRSQSIPPSPSRSYPQLQPHNPAHSRPSTAQSSPLPPSTELPLVSWGSVQNYNPPCSVHHMQLQLQEWYQQQQRLGELPQSSPFISAQASQQLAVHFSSQQTRSSTSSPSKSRSGHSRPPNGNEKTRVSPSQTHHQQTNPRPAHIVSSSVHLLAPHAPPLTQPALCMDQVIQSLRICSQAPQMAQSRSLQTRLSELPPLSSLWSDSAANQTLAYLHQTLLNEYDIPARDLTVVHYQRLYDGYFEELERDLQRGEDRMWVMGMALEEDERTAAQERGERSATRDAEEMEQDTVQDLTGNLKGGAAHVECTYSPVPSEITLKLEERAPIGDETPQTLEVHPSSKDTNLVG